MTASAPAPVLLRTSVLALAVVLAGCGAPPAAPPAPSTFDSPAAAANALFVAAQKNDEPALLALFGADGRDLVLSGDPAEDKTGRETFVEKYQKMHRIGLDAQNRTALLIGAENWPFPIPLVQHDGKWSFDTDAGKREVLYRRIGRNENAAIDTCEQLAAAEKEYFASPHDGEPAHQYAQHFVSSAGKHDGLFWEADGKTESPIGPLLAFAGSETAAKALHQGPVPFHGYLFHMLRAQGKDMPGGAKSFVVDGRMTGGFGFIAYPADYRSSGVMTFAVGPDGIVYQRDLGAEGATVAHDMTELDLDTTWAPAQSTAAGL